MSSQTVIDSLALSVGASTKTGGEPVGEHSDISNPTTLDFLGVYSSTAREKWAEVLLLRNGSLVVSDSQEKPPWVESAFLKIQELLYLEAGWDGYDGKSVIGDTARKAVVMLFELMSSGTKTPWIVPTVHGGLQMEWHKSQVDLEIEIKPDTTASVFYVNEQDGKQLNEPFDAAKVRLLLNEFE